MNTSEKSEFVNKIILEKIVKGYVIGDIKRMVGIEVVENANGNLNFPIVLYIFSAMDFLGYLIAETEYSLSGDNSKRIMSYINLTFSAEAKADIEIHRDVFINKFRNGLSHEFFPKMAGISRTNNKLFTKSKEDYWVLDADILATIFIASVKELEKLLSDSGLITRVYNRYFNIQNMNKDLKNTPTISFTSTDVRVSRVTTTTLPHELIEKLDDNNFRDGTVYSKGDTGVAGIEDER